MILAKTKQKQDLLVDLRNGLIFMRDGRGGWEHVPLKSSQIVLEQGKPIGVSEILGLLDGLILVNVEPYTGPHPGGPMRCNCGVFRDEDGECPRCDYGRCHVCKTALKDGRCPVDVTHNPIPVPVAPKYKEERK